MDAGAERDAANGMDTDTLLLSGGVKSADLPANVPAIVQCCIVSIHLSDSDRCPSEQLDASCRKKSAYSISFVRPSIRSHVKTGRRNLPAAQSTDRRQSCIQSSGF